MLASSLSQNIGSRATKASKAAQQEWRLRDTAGNLLDGRLAMSNPDKWAWEKPIPALQKGADVNDNLKVTEVLSKLFLNRVVGDVFSRLITAGAVSSEGRALLAELRKSISAKASSKVVALELEEQAARLIDQIERLARLPQTTEGTRH